MTKFIRRLILFSSPLFLWLLINYLFFPLGYLNFRSWEAVQPKVFTSYFSGPFYPNIELKKIEKGDLGPHTDFAIDKKVFWQTDKYGYRASDQVGESEIVIIGDSNIAGSGLSQEETLPSVLGEKIDKNIYSYARNDLPHFLKEDRFLTNKPKLVVLSSIERGLVGLCDPKTKIKKDERFALSNKFFQYNYILDSFMTLLDRSLDPNFLKYLYYKIAKTEPAPLYTYAAGPVLFLQGASANSDLPEEEVERIAQNISSCQQSLEALNIKMIFLPIPNKENIYYKLLPGQKKPKLLESLDSKLRARGVQTVNLEKIFRQYYQEKGDDLYHLDDTHWNSLGVNLAAEALSQKIKKDLE